MSAFSKRSLALRALNFVGLSKTVNILGRPDSTEKVLNLAFAGFVRTSFLRDRTDTFALTGVHGGGIAAAASATVVTATALTTAVQTIVASSMALSTLDFARCLTVKGTVTGMGDSTYVGAAARAVTIVGTDQFGRVIQESISLNGTNSITSTLAFKTVTTINLPAYSNNGSDSVAVGISATLGFHGIPYATAINYERKAAAATAYTVETSPSTVDITPLFGTLSANIAATTTTTLTIGASDTWTSGAQRIVARIYGPDGDYETVMVTDNTSQTLTIVRGVGGTAKAWPKGSVIVSMPGYTFTTTITANDRLKISYLTKYL